MVAAIQRIDPALGDGLARPDPMQAGLSPDAGKTALLARFEAKHGAAALLQIGQHLDLAEESPVLAVLTRSPDPDVLAEKWMRLERYHHSSHRTQIDRDTPNRWTCRRVSKADPATAAENLLIAGVLLGLLRQLGLQECRLTIEGRVIAAGKAEQPALRGDAGCFALRWRPAATPEAPPPGPSGSVNDRLTDLLAGDIGRSWRLRDAARQLAWSERSLQRHLGRTGRSFSSVLRRARMREATQLLTETDTTLAEIGYCCGYADQAHFQRDFRRVTNMTPRVFRSVSGSTGAPLR